MNKENEKKSEDMKKVPDQAVPAPETSSNSPEVSEEKNEVQKKQSNGSEGIVKEAPEGIVKEAQAPKKAAPEAAKKGNNARGKWAKRDARDETEDSGIIEKVISINRITKVTKGGKKMSFSALVVVGDTQGNVGYSLSKAAEVATAIRKAMATAKKNMVKIPMRGTTIPHEIIGQCGGSRVLLKPASDGTGVIASGPVRAICDGAGIHNILTKCHRSNNPINVVKATIDGLTRLKSMDEEVKEKIKEEIKEEIKE